MIARRCGIRDICAITGYSKGKVQRTIAHSNYIHSPKKQHYSELEIDEFHTFIGNKKKHAYCRCFLIKNVYFCTAKHKAQRIYGRLSRGK